MKKKIYTVASSHLDTVWSWDFETTVKEYIYNTLVDNFKLFEKYPTYKFSFEGSYRYELMEEYYPELFEKMKEYVKAGRWNVCGSSFENGDVNVPSPEALFRNILFGNSYFDKTFGKRSVDIFLPDCFGFGWALPSIANHANLMGFTTQKLAWGSAYGVPFDIGRWQGVDGKEIYASCNPHDYYFTLKKLRDWDFVQNKLKENEKYDLNMTYLFHGIGDRGGAPAEASVKLVEEEIKKNSQSDVEVIAASADEIYHDIDEKFSDEQKAKLPVWKNELVMQNHGAGGYTSRAVGKRWNRRCQELADVAERGSVMSSYLGTCDYNQESLNRSWKRFVAHQFHDDLPGTSCQRVYRRSWNDYAISMNQFTNELEAAVAPVSQLMKTDFCSGIPVMVYNPIEADRRGAVTVRLTDAPSDYVRVYDEKGKEIKSQVKVEKDYIEVVFVADVKSLGVRIYDIRPSDKPCCVKSDISINTDNVMENQKYIVTLNRKGNICSILDKEQDELELLKEPISLGLFKYTGSKSWPSWEMNFKEANKEADRIPNVVTVTVLEQGPARVAFQVIQRDGKSTFSTIVALTDGCDVVEVYSEIEWRSLQTLAKNKFSFTASNGKATFDLGLGAIERENMSEKLFEVPAQSWVDLTDKSGDFGISVISECKYGWDKFKDNTLRMTVLHTPRRNYRIDSMQSLLDLGLNRYSYAIYSHKGKVGADTQLEARKFITPMTAYVCTKHQGSLKTEYSFGSVSTNDVIIRAIKKAENSDEIVVRLGEGAKKSVKDFTLTLGDGIESAREIYASEEPKGAATVNDGRLVTDFEPYEIKSFALKLKTASIQGIKAESTPIELPFDKNIITRQGETGDFEYTIPYEIMPDIIESNGVVFNINKDKNNALTAKGQAFTVPDTANKTVLLCASLNGDRKAELKVGETTVNCQINSCFERFAQWDLYDFEETAYIKDGKLAYDSTHSHKDGKDVYAKGMYFYLVELDTSKDKKINLPNDENIVILSASAVKAENAYLATPAYDEVERRPFDYKMSFTEKLNYIRNKCVWRLNDRDNFIKDNNRGRTETEYIKG